MTIQEAKAKVDRAEEAMKNTYVAHKRAPHDIGYLRDHLDAEQDFDDAVAAYDSINLKPE